MNFTDTFAAFTNALAYILDHPAAAACALLMSLFIHLSGKSGKQKKEIKKLTEENEKLTSENQKLQTHAKIGESLLTTVNAFKG